MGRRERALDRRPEPVSAGPKFAVALGAIGLLTAGLWMVVGFVVTKVDIAEKRDRLPREGTEITATVVELHAAARAGIKHITLAYNVDGRRYQARIMCAGPTGCHRNRPGPTMQIWYDPAAPAEFVAANKNTDNSRSFFNAIFTLVLGLLTTTVGGLLTWIRLTINDGRRGT